jgi:hypothetical protein
MLRALLYGLAILHLGPGIAFAVLAFGCDPSRPILGAVCQGNTLAVFLGLTVTLWLALGVGTAAVLGLRRRPAKGAAAIDA